MIELIKLVVKNRIRVAGTVSQYTKRKMEKLVEEGTFAGESDMINHALILLINNVEMERKGDKKDLFIKTH